MVVHIQTVLVVAVQLNTADIVVVADIPVVVHGDFVVVVVVEVASMVGVVAVELVGNILRMVVSVQQKELKRTNTLVAVLVLHMDWH